MPLCNWEPHESWILISIWWNSVYYFSDEGNWITRIDALSGHRMKIAFSAVSFVAVDVSRTRKKNHQKGQSNKNETFYCDQYFSSLYYLFSMIIECGHMRNKTDSRYLEKKKNWCVIIISWNLLTPFYYTNSSATDGLMNACGLCLSISKLIEFQFFSFLWLIFLEKKE
jgi:hypothetical protein